MNENVAATFDGNATMAGSYPKLRLFSMAEAGADSPQRDIPAFTGVHTTPCTFPQYPADPATDQRCNAWQAAVTPSLIGSFSAVCLYTALALQKTITDGRYIGLIHASVSGTPMRQWATQQAISTCDAVASGGGAAPLALPVPPSGSFPPGNATLWNAMIHPISRYSIRAVLWFVPAAEPLCSVSPSVCHTFPARLSARRLPPLPPNAPSPLLSQLPFSHSPNAIGIKGKVTAVSSPPTSPASLAP